MSVTVKVDVDQNKILSKRGIGSSTLAQKLLADQIVAKCDPYVPMDTGMLKNNHSISSDGKTITYKQKYASRQYKGNFKHYSNNYSGLRGGNWVGRMMQTRGKEILNAVADYIGGKAK